MSEIQKILCPVGFASPSEHAFEYAVGLAGKLGAALELLHVTWPVPVMMTHPAAMTAAGDGELQRRQHEASKDLLQQMETRARSAGVPVLARVLTGDVYRELYAEINDVQPDIVVMGTHARHGFDRWLYGSVTEKTIRHCPVPILVVPDSRTNEFPIPPTIGRVLVATDSVAELEHAMKWIPTLGGTAEVDILHVVPRASGAKDALVGLTRVLDDLAGRAGTGLERKRLVPHVEIGTPHDRILDLADRLRPDLIVVNPHDRSWIARLFEPATVESVIREAPCPVMTLPERDAETPATDIGAKSHP